MTLDMLTAEVEKAARQLKELLADLDWRAPDVAGEEEKLRLLREEAKTNPDVGVESQEMVVRVLRGVLNDKLLLAEELGARLEALKAQLIELSPRETARGEEKPDAT